MIRSPAYRLAAKAMALSVSTITLASCAALPDGVRPSSARSTGAAFAAPNAISVPAQALETFARNAQGIDSPSGPTAVNTALNLGAAHDPKQLEAGVVAFAAMAALREPSFVAGVKAASRKPAAKQALAGQLTRNPMTAMQIAGAKPAAGRANAALRDLSAPLLASGREVKRSSYSVQHQAWSKVSVTDPKARLSRVKQISATGYRPGGDDAQRLIKAVSDGGRQGAAASPAVARGLAVAALTVMGEPARAKSLLKEPNAGLCLRIAKLNFFQCLASAGPYYEDIYCLGEHAMIEPAQCISAATEPRRKSAQTEGPALFL